MPRPAPLMALKPYLERVRACCERLDAEALIRLISGLAAGVPVSQRTQFLARVEGLSSKPGAARTGDESLLEGILESADALREDVAERRASIEDGSYWEAQAERDVDIAEGHIQRIEKEAG